MRVQFSLVGHIEQITLEAELDAVPREGEIINIPGISQATTYVRTVVWYPTHDDENNPVEEPFVYIVVGPNRADSFPGRLEQYLSGRSPDPLARKE